MMYCSVLCVGFLLIAFFPFTQAYHFNCPSLPHWKLRGYGLCNSSFQYTCLFDTNEGEYKEKCVFNINRIGPGFKFVISGMLDRRPCGSARFQPFSLRSNFSSRCVMSKSHCNGEGQVVYNKGTTTDGITCRCNYNIKFAFVSHPTSSCFCVPSQEDCSCYKKACPVDQYLTPDYKCVHLNNWTGNFQCPEIPLKKPTDVEPTLINPIAEFGKDSIHVVLPLMQLGSTLLVFFSCCTGILLLYREYRSSSENAYGRDPQTQSTRTESENITKEIECLVLKAIREDVSKKPVEIVSDDVYYDTEC